MQTWQQSPFSLLLMPLWLGTQQKTMSFLAKFKDTLSYHHPNQGRAILFCY